MRTCRECGSEKPIADFYVFTSTGKPHAKCKECVKARERARHHGNSDRRKVTSRAWYRENAVEQRQRGKARSRKWEIANPEKAREKGRLTMARRRSRDPERVNATRRRDYQRHAARRNATTKAWRDRNPERVNALAMKSKARRRGRLANVAVEHVDRLKVFERDGWVCQICRKPVTPKDASIDHRVPLAKGGAHTYENCQTAHLKCNISKGARLQEQTT